MHVIRGLHNLTASHRGCVATIGNFDGVHRGHQAILQQCREHAARLNVPLTVVVFEPQPREFFAGDQAPPRLTRLREKVRLLRDHGAEQVLCLGAQRANKGENKRRRCKHRHKVVCRLLVRRGPHLRTRSVPGLRTRPHQIWGRP